jgi:hypothetical protein
MCNSVRDSHFACKITADAGTGGVLAKFLAVDQPGSYPQRPDVLTFK